MSETTGPAVSGDSDAAFCITHWSVVLAAGKSFTPPARAALEELCRTYWFPLYAYLRRRGLASHDAQDTVQEFLLHLINRNAFQELSPEKGRFRSFLLACLRHFLADAGDRRHAQKRGGNQALISLDAEAADRLYQLEAKQELGADQLFDRRWALTLLEAALDQLAGEQRAADKAQQFALLQPFLTETAGTGDYLPVAAQLGMTPNAVGVAINRLRRRYRELIRLAVADTLADPAQVEAEMQHLLSAMRSA